jgi:hypothetical protein
MLAGPVQARMRIVYLRKRGNDADWSMSVMSTGASTNGKSCLFPCADFSDHHGVDASGVWCPVSAHRARACIDVADVPDSVRGKDPRQRDMKHAKGKNGEPNLE